MYAASCYIQYSKFICATIYMSYYTVCLFIAAHCLVLSDRTDLVIPHIVG